MKHNPILKLIRLVMIIPVLLLLFSSCGQEEPYSAPSPGFTPVTLSVSVSNDAAPASGDPASVVKDLCILQFYANNDGSFGTLRHAGMCDPTAGSKYTTRLLQSNNGEMYKFVVVANLPRHGFVYYQNLIGKSYAEVQQALLSESSEARLDFTAATPFPMFGTPKNGTPQAIGATLNLGSVSLVRAVARVDIGIGEKSANADTWTKNGVRFNMNQVQIWKAGKQYAYMPLESRILFDEETGELDIKLPSPVGAANTTPLTYSDTDITNGTYCAGKIYLPEADLLWGDDKSGTVFDTNHTNRLAIIVGGYYNGSTKETFYRVDFTNEQTLPITKLDILRNHHYRFTIKSVTDEGYGTAELAYNSVPKNIGFTTEVILWDNTFEASVPSPIGYRMLYNDLNGGNVLWRNTGSSPPYIRTYNF